MTLFQFSVISFTKAIFTFRLKYCYYTHHSVIYNVIISRFLISTISLKTYVLSTLRSICMYINCDNLWQILYHRTLTKWDTSGIFRTWNGMKISRALWWDGKREPGNPLVSRIARASSNGIVFVRNPIYQAFLHQACSAPRFAVFLYAIPPAFQAWSTETTVVVLSGTFTMSRWFTCLPYQKTAIPDRVDFSPVWCDSYYHLAFLSSPFLSWHR